MHFDGILKCGILLLVPTALAVQDATLPLRVVALYSFGALYYLQYRIPKMARTKAEARQAFGLVLAMQAIVAALMVWAHPSLGTRLVAVGQCLNLIVVAANRLQMPFVRTTIERIDHPYYREMGPWTRLWWLGDRYLATGNGRLLPDGTRIYAFSPGDILECLGIWALAAELTVAGIIMRYFV